ncbi:hypothetical protein [Tenacibaculum sp. 190524A02b]|uniref:hypothetical protein n=1 Tax=Tenacibaculum vairaonense TaxID=3137860 RepID=UPI0031FB144C
MLYTKLKHKLTIIKELTDLGVVSSHWLRNIEVFEDFHSQPELCAECRYELLSEKFKISSESVKKIILKLRK